MSSATNIWRFKIGVVMLMVASPAVAFAGMPHFSLTDVGKMRLDTLSFFALAFFVSSWILQRLWNGLSRDFPRLPRLGYWRATSLVAIWGLLFVIVLTMISGARELLTPGAWEKFGLTYKLAEPKSEELGPPTAEARRAKLERLRNALEAFSLAHEGNLPANDLDRAIDGDIWQTPDPSGVRYIYVSGLRLYSGSRPLAFEPPFLEGDSWVLFTTGEVRTVPSETLQRLLSAPEAPP